MMMMMNASVLNATATDRGFTWSDDETGILLQLWSDTFLNTDLPNVKNKNFILYERISEHMNSMGFIRTASQCKEKIKRMKREYTVTKQRNQSGKNKKTMRFYDQFEKILNDIQIKNLERAAANSNDVALELGADEMNINRNERKLRHIAPKTELPKLRKRTQLFEKIKETSNPWTPDVLLIEEETQPTTSKMIHSVPSHKSENGEPIQKKKSNSQTLLFKCMMESLTSKFLKYQAESDMKMLSKLEELEKERSAMNERITKMWLDFEERRQNDEKEHELNLMSTFQDIINESKNIIDAK